MRIANVSEVKTLYNVEPEDLKNGTYVPPENLNAIGAEAFFGSPLTRITLTNKSNSLTTIGRHAFAYCTNLSRITLPNGLIHIDEYAFLKCEALTNITLPNSLATIGTGAFQECSNLTNITFPDTLTAIPVAVCLGCINLTNITLPDNLKTIPAAAFKECTNLTNVTLPDNLVTIDEGAFQHCENLNNVILPNSLATIDTVAFQHCESLTSIMLPNKVTTIRGYAFGNCRNLTSVTLPDGLVTIDNGVFEGCESLTNITLPNNLATIGEAAFNHCKSLTSITIPNKVTTIGKHAFAYCTNLSRITLPDSLISIGESAFIDCKASAQIIINTDDPVKFERIKNLLPEKLRSKIVPYDLFKKADKFQQELLSKFNITYRLDGAESILPGDVLGEIRSYIPDPSLKVQLAAVPIPHEDALEDYKVKLNDIYQNHLVAFNIEQYSNKLTRLQQRLFSNKMDAPSSFFGNMKKMLYKKSNINVGPYQDLLKVLSHITKMLQENKIVKLSKKDLSLLTERSSILNEIPLKIREQMGIGVAQIVNVFKKKLSLTQGPSPETQEQSDISQENKNQSSGTTSSK